MRSRIIIILLQIREIGARGRGGGNVFVCVLDNPVKEMGRRYKPKLEECLCILWMTSV